MITSNLSILMGKHRISISELSRLTKLSRNTIHNLYHDRTKQIDFNTASTLCHFFGCEIGDLFKFNKELPY